jgi:hypothetical protein
MFVEVILEDGPCAGQKVQVSPGIGGLMPREFMACRPAEHREGPAPLPQDYHRYLRVGNYQSTSYTYAKDAQVHAT